MSWRTRTAIVVTTLCALACNSGDDAPNDAFSTTPGNFDTRLGVGTDTAGTQQCLGCHDAVNEDWQHPSTHRQLLDCTTCHTADLTAPGPGHADRPECSTCHSQLEHSEQACTTCHNQHGSPNAYLIRAVLDLPDGGAVDIHFTRPEGASVDGLVRKGVEGAVAGSGLCEVCHERDHAYYNREGVGDDHESTWCASCHTHSTGFIAEAAPEP
jgi:hypothetical protein